MTGTNPIIFMLLLLIAWQTYSVLDANKKIWCVFRRVDRTKIGKWAKQYQGRIEFDNGWYQVESDRVTTVVKWLPLPTICKSLDFTPNSTRAIDPSSGRSDLSPEERKALDTSDDMRALKEGNQQTLKGGTVKQGMLAQYMPIITIAGFVIIGYFIYTLMGRVDQLGFSGNVIQTQLAKIMQNAGIK